jgi:hypothetical protein
MNTKRFITGAIYIVFALGAFYDGAYKVAHWGDYSCWLQNAPLLNPVAGILMYLIPLGEITVSTSILIPSFRLTALLTIIVALLLFVLWIMTVYLFTNRLFWPYHALFDKPTWMQKILISLGLSWAAFFLFISTMRRGRPAKILIHHQPISQN